MADSGRVSGVGGHAKTERVEKEPQSAVWDTTLARAVAAALVVNSHLEGFYPAPWLADGGLLGNLTFFVVSGLGLGLSPSTGLKPFPVWYWRRLARIYPAVWLCVIPLAVVVGGGWSNWEAGDYFARLVWPIEGYHFLMRIIVYYAILYYAIRFRMLGLSFVLAAFASLLSAWVLPSAPADATRFSTGLVPDEFRWLFYLFCVLAGAWLGRFSRPDRLSFVTSASSLVLLSVAYVILKYVIVVRQCYISLYPLLFAVSLSLVIALVFVSVNARVLGAVGRVFWLASAVTLVGGASLEIYLIHFQLIHLGASGWGPFPVNLALFLAATLMLSLFAHWTVSRLSRR